MSKLFLTIQLLGLSYGLSGQGLTIAHNRMTSYCILLPEGSKEYDQKAAMALQKYIHEATGAKLDILPQHKNVLSPYISVGNPKRESLFSANQREESIIILTNGRNLVLAGKGKKGNLYAVYTFLERYLGCRKWATGPPYVPKLSTLSIPANLRFIEEPDLEFRQAYFSLSTEEEYRDWHKLHLFTNLWGLWAHSFNNLVPPTQYFKSNPEYYALVNGIRSTSQLCLSEEGTVNAAILTLKKLMKEKPEAKYWSIAANDQAGFCTCDKCRPITQQEGGVAGNLIRFVNKIAAVFPDRTFTTLAYTLTRKPPRSIRPAQNVIVMISTIDGFKTNPIIKEPSMSSFIEDLKAWKKLTNRIFIWDYMTQFTNYLTPFPVVQNFSPNMQFFRREGMMGIFAQGSGAAYSDMAELKSYVLAKLMWNKSTKAENIIREFMNGYYGKASPFLQEYVNQMYVASTSNHSKLRLFGNPAEGRFSYLAQVNMQQYDFLLSKAESAVKQDATMSERVAAVRMCYDFAYLQLARFYGAEKEGIFQKKADGNYTVSERVKTAVERFERKSAKIGNVQLTESGGGSKAFVEEFRGALGRIPKAKALNAKVKLISPNLTAYPANGPQTLTDGMEGSLDVGSSYLCFQPGPMVALVDLGKSTRVKKISISFLHSPHKVMMRPQYVKVEISADGKTFATIGTETSDPLIDNQKVMRVHYDFNGYQKNLLRYLKVTATAFRELPARYSKATHPIIACDEIWVE